MPLLMNSTALIPAPLVEISRQRQSAADGTNLGQVYQITLKGTLVAVPPGGTPIEQAARLGVLLAKQKQLAQLFDTDGKPLEIYSPDGTNVIRCNPKVISIDFAEGIWVERTDYTIVLEAPTLYPGDPAVLFNVSDVSDEWQIEEAGFTTEDGGASLTPVWQLTHTCSAKGKPKYDENGVIGANGEAWKQARDWVVDRLSTSNFNAKPFDTVGELSIADGGQGYSHTRKEDVNILEGSFSLTETWVLARGLPALEDYTISIKRTPEEQTSTSVTVSGTIKGLSTGINQLQSRMANAISYFNNNVKANLVSRANLAVPDITLSQYGVAGSTDYNYAEGTLSYTYDYSDRVSATADETVTDIYTVTKKSSIEEAEITVTVQGTITGRLSIGEPPSNLLKYQRAKTYWQALLAANQILVRANLSGVGNLKPSSLNTSVDDNFFEGSITYSYDFNNRLNDTARNEYTTTIKTSREEGRTVVGVEGTITGLRQAETDPITQKYTNALAFWSGWESEIIVKANGFAGTVELNSQPFSVSRGDSPFQGTINYNYEYNTDVSPTITGAISQQVTINDTKATDVFAVIPVLGRVFGPILQDIGSKKETTRTVTLDVVMQQGFGKPNNDEVTAVINSYRPEARKVFVDRNEENWVPAVGRFSKNVAWVYEV